MLTNWYGIVGTYKVPVEDVTIDKEYNKLDIFKIKTANDAKMRAVLRKDVNVDIYKDRKKVMTGIIKSRRFPETTMWAGGYQYGLKLDYDLFSKDQGQVDFYRVLYDNIAADTILTDVLAGTEFSIGSCPSTVIPGIRFEYATNLDCVKGIAKALTKDWWIIDTLVYIGDKGVDRGEVEIADVTSTEDSDEVVRAIHMLGSGDGINQPKAYVEDLTVIGGREIALVNRDIIDETLLANIAQAKLDELKVPSLKIPVTMDPDKFPYIEVGDTISVVAPDQEISGVLKVKKAYIGALDKTKVQLENITETLTDLQRKDVDGLSTLSSVEQGNTNIWSVDFTDNCDATHPLTRRFYLPPELVAINRLKLHYLLEDFRAFSTGVATSSSTVETSTSDEHGMGVNTAMHKFQVRDHRHNTVSHRHQLTVANDNHNHPIKIYDSAGAGDDVNMMVDTYNYDFRHDGGGGTFYTLRTENVDHASDYTDYTTPSTTLPAINNLGTKSITADVFAPEPSGTTYTGVYVETEIANDNGTGRTYWYKLTNVTKGTTLVSLNSVYIPADSEATFNAYYNSSQVAQNDSLKWEVYNIYTFDELKIGIYSFGAHTHDVTVPGHSHGISYGIYESNSGTPTCTVKLDGGTLYTGLVGDQQDLDLGTLTTGLHTLEIIPDKLVRFNGGMYVQAFIRST